VVINAATTARYLKGLGLEHEPPSIDALRRLQRAHVERIPYETIWLHLDEPWTTDPAASVERIVHGQRGGYCFHLNGALHELLCALGYQSERHAGCVHGPEGPTPERRGNHLALTVSGLPDPEGTSNWYVDAGLGDALHDVIALREGSYTQHPMTFTMTRQPDLSWRLDHDRNLGSFAGMTFSTATAQMVEFAEMHHYLATSPESHFARTVTVQRRDATGVDVLRGLVLRRIGTNASEQEFQTSTEWFEMLADLFQLPLTHVTPQARQALWDKTHAIHLCEAHLRSSIAT
jgi:N-hydroxyarylamine O-acetyltransferase